MIIEYLVLGLYLLLSLLIIPRISFIKNAGLSSSEIRILLCLKIIIGLTIAFYVKEVATNSQDYIGINAEGSEHHKLLLTNPAHFFSDFTTDIHSYGLGRLFDSEYSFWAYLRFNLLYKFIAVLDLITKGNFYFNTVIFCTIVFFGNVAFYRVYNEIYKGNNLKILLACFFLPSVLVYTACIHKDGMVFLSLGLVSYSFYRILSSTKGIRAGHLLTLTGCLAIIFLFRNYVVVALLPAMAIAMFCKYFSSRKKAIILAAYSFFFLLFFLSGFSKSSLNLPAAVVQRKADFAALGPATTNIPMNDLLPTLQSFILNLPQAINHYLFQPYLWEFPQLSVVLTAIELFVYQVIILSFIFFRKKQQLRFNNFNIFGLTLLFNMILIIGYTIPNIGAIVRYRSIFWIFLICPLVCLTDWKRLSGFYRIAGKTL